MENSISPLVHVRDSGAAVTPFVQVATYVTRNFATVGQLELLPRLYHLVHTASLVSAPLTKNPNIFGGLLTTGRVAFSRTCYAVAYLEDRKYSKLAPFGGFTFIAAWASLLF